ncbi:hypothetical protein COW99_03720 [Candidatus Roizmanbacteria bacterium CG22_combo_CG10-13_8_21_14_all_38_20]|uniref:DUF2191 domain-containing protein n=1 Tax=Candidatus Roizmanbacteria bacterium CG22_combo_CG10-13_8_21_14_all_38_20 TaxID=1974862 RepID=A0A2H0BWS6_9BACT|nr:hypothetical protein [Candidatus Microgenomates bacterium]PIP61500.1 MAG: hypothetical protein COW99_03720 [Candidatus Roizmanbacteria bacterium CG22_combo_CG10-13_8_21_14_all_38_20]PJC32266.1 MAG: hypothetical protein CO050_00395 [Candidatus Roizmanbacteria bacterium CG_4_9_14_0_2_um_filter_38_17]
MTRTTIRIPDELLKRAKVEAATRDVPLYQVVTDALRQRYASIVHATGKYLLYDKDMGETGELSRADYYD